MAYSTRIKLNKGSHNHKSSLIGSRKYPGKTEHNKSLRKRILARLKGQRTKRVIKFSCGLFLIFLFIGGLLTLSWVQSLTEDLPTPDKPFGKKDTASEIFDRNGKLLYKVFGNENRDPVKIDEVPELMRWSYLAAEDIDFYKHGGVDIPGIIRCGINKVIGKGECGASTITQQLITTTVINKSDRTINRKVSEIILSMQIEAVQSKDSILEMYFNVVPEGSNLYGIKSAASYYFGKNLKDLTLAEMAVLASIPKDPSRLSPTKPYDGKQEDSQVRVRERSQYVLDQMEKYMDQINSEAKELHGYNDPILTKDMIAEARTVAMNYRPPKVEIKAPHFVFYVEKMLQQRPYNNGEPFTLAEVETGGYKIYTTLDLDFQQYAENRVKQAVEDPNGGKKYGAENAAMVALNPRNGQVLAWVGSKDYNAAPSPAGCTVGKNCKFEPAVNIPDTLQSYGSSMKPMIYYDAIMKGLINPASLLADVPIQIGNYKPKNYSGGFTGIRPARIQLTDSQNIPAIMLADTLGVDNYIKDVAEKWGYTTFTNAAGYGPSIAVGGGDIRLIEHAQAYSVLANGGTLATHEVVLKIVDRDGNEIYNATPKLTDVADPRGVYLVNDMLNGKNGGPPGKTWRNKAWGRDIAGKTGTSEDQKETLYATYTPEIVAVGWVGNNDNTPMRYGASGFVVAKPWVADFIRDIEGAIPPTPFTRPAGITSGSSCKAAEGLTCEGFGNDLAIAGIDVPSYVNISTATVCTDQPDKLARDIDISLGKSLAVTVKQYKMVDPKLQSFLDTYLAAHPELGLTTMPTLPCDINRNPTGTLTPWAAISSPADNSVLGSSMQVNFTAYTPNVGATITSVSVSLDNNVLDTAANVSTYSKTFTVTGQSQGTHVLKIDVTDSTGAKGSTSISLLVPPSSPPAAGTITITKPNNGQKVKNSAATAVDFTFTGAPPTNIELYANGVKTGSCTPVSCTWNSSGMVGPVNLVVKAISAGTPIQSAGVDIVLI